MHVPAGAEARDQQGATEGEAATRVDIESTVAAPAGRWKRSVIAVAAVTALIAGVAAIDTDRRIETTDASAEAAADEVTSADESIPGEPSGAQDSAVTASPGVAGSSVPAPVSVTVPTPTGVTTPAAPSTTVSVPVDAPSPPVDSGHDDVEPVAPEPYQWAGRIFVESDRADGIYSIAADGSDLRHEIATDLAVRPRLSPDGEWLYYMVLSPESSIKPDIRRRSLAGVDELVLQRGEWWGDFQISPDGERLALIGSHHLYVADIGTGAMRLIDVATDYPANVYGATWGPDSRTVVVSLGAPEGLAIVDVDSGSQRQILPTGFAPSWSPDGASIVFVGKVLGSQGLFILEMATGHVTPINVRPIGSLGPSPSNPTWSRDGTRIVYTFRAGALDNDLREYTPLTGSDRVLMTAAVNGPDM